MELCAKFCGSMWMEGLPQKTFVIPLSSCRVLRKLRQKNPGDIELERREKGFALYVNGANTATTSLAAGAGSSACKNPH